MITILYFVLIYTLLGGLVYLIAQSQADEELTPFKQELFLFLGWVFKIIIILIILLDSYIFLPLKQKATIRWIKKQYNKQLKNKNLTDEDRQEIIKKRDTLVAFFSNVGQSEIEEDEE